MPSGNDHKIAVLIPFKGRKGCCEVFTLHLIRTRFLRGFRKRRPIFDAEHLKTEHFP